MRNLVVAAVAALLAVPASAGVFNFSYSSMASDDAVFGSHVDVSGQLTMTDTPIYGNVLGITAVTGQRNGVAIDGIEDFFGNNTYDSVTHAIDFSFIVDNGFYNLYSQGFSLWSEYDGEVSRTSANFTLTPAAAEVPEPAMIGLFGLAAIGLGLSRRRKA